MTPVAMTDPGSRAAVPAAPDPAGLGEAPSGRGVASGIRSTGLVISASATRMSIDALTANACQRTISDPISLASRITSTDQQPCPAGVSVVRPLRVTVVVGRVVTLAQMSRLGIAAAVATGVVDAAVWWRKDPSACPYGQRIWIEAPHPFITRGRLFEALEPRPGETLLEVGPGTGNYTIAAARRLFSGGRLCVFDIQQEMLDHTMRRAAANGLTDIEPTRGDAQQLPYADSRFDGAFLVTVLGESPTRQPPSVNCAACSSRMGAWSSASCSAIRTWSLNAEDTEAVADAVRRAGVLSGVGFCYRFAPAVAHGVRPRSATVTGHPRIGAIFVPSHSRDGVIGRHRRSVVSPRSRARRR
jgi:SAM-dependent methyltransferase